MSTFHLKVVTPDGVYFDAMAEQLIVRTTTGDVGILAGHIDFASALGMGRAVIVSEGQRRTACCIGGVVSVIDNKVTLMPTTFEWSEHIDIDRAKASEIRANSVINDKNASVDEIRLAEARLKRALVRKSVAETK